MRPRSQEYDDGSGRVFRWALLISILLHLLLIPLTRFAPAGLLARAADGLPEPANEIRFTFAPEAEVEAEGRAATRPETEPVPLPPAPPSVEPSPTIAAELVPRGVPDPAPRAAEAPASPRATAETAEADDRSGATLDPGGADLVREGTGPEAGRRPAEPGGRPFDLGRAMQEFDGRMAAAQPNVRPGGVPTVVFQPGQFELPPTGTGVGNLTFSSTDYDWNSYGRQVYIALWRAWHSYMHRNVTDFEQWAQEARETLHHDNRFRFVIHADGSVRGVLHLKDSGSPPLDRSSAGALAEVVLPPLPEDFPRRTEEVHVVFIARGPVFADVLRQKFCPTTGRGDCFWADGPRSAPAGYGLADTQRVTRSSMRENLDRMAKLGYF